MNHHEHNISAPMPQACLATIETLAAAIGLDAAQLAQGRPVHYKGVDFYLGHHGEADPCGLMLMINIGTLPEEAQALACRRLLEHNTLTPAALRGYFSLMPGTDIVLSCIRFDLERTPDASDAILALIATIASELDAMTQSFRAEFERMDAGQANLAA